MFKTYLNVLNFKLLQFPKQKCRLKKQSHQTKKQIEKYEIVIQPIHKSQIMKKNNNLKRKLKYFKRNY